MAGKSNSLIGLCRAPLFSDQSKHLLHGHASCLYCVCRNSFFSFVFSKMKASSTEESTSNDESGCGDAVFDRIRSLFGEAISEALLSKFCCTVFHSFVYTVKSFIKLFLDK